MVSAQVVWASGSAGTVLRTVDGGRTWTTFDTGSFDTVDCVPSRNGPVCWASGESGRLALLTGLRVG